MQELIKVESKPALLSVNFDELKKQLETELEKYDVVVTVDTVADAKKLATELNKTKGVIDQRRKDEVAKASEPIKAFDASMKELVKMCSDGRQKLLDQVAKFEDETKKVVEELLYQCRQYLFEKHNVNPEFYKAEFDDLIKISALTAKGNLTKAVKDELNSRVMKDKAIQGRTEYRLLQLGNISFNAGLSAPLTRDHVIGFLFADDKRYQSEVERIVAVEIERQEQAEIALRKKMQREQELQDQVAPASTKESEPHPTQQPVSESEPVAKVTPEPPAPPASGKIPYEVTAVFHTDVPAGVNEAAIAAELRKVLAKAGITTLNAIYVKQAAHAA